MNNHIWLIGLIGVNLQTTGLGWKLRCLVLCPLSLSRFEEKIFVVQIEQRHFEEDGEFLTDFPALSFCIFWIFLHCVFSRATASELVDGIAVTTAINMR